MNNLIGQSLGRYHITEKLGEGGMAIVYKAFDTHLDCDVAVKVIRTDQLAPAVMERALKRFEREAKAVAKLTHANIVKVTDYGEYETYPYIVMVYLPGGTLKQYIKDRGKLDWKDAFSMLIPVVEALEYAHEQSVIHRDVKPSNILLTSKGQPMLTDFGVAKIIDEESTQDLTGTSATVGTPEYMAPEQVLSKTVDHRADIYSLGVVLYEMVTGRRPFKADTPMAVLFKHAGEPLPRPTSLVSDLPEEVEQILIKALAKKPEDRYQGMGEFLLALDKKEMVNLPQKRSPNFEADQVNEKTKDDHKMIVAETYETRMELTGTTAALNTTDMNQTRVETVETSSKENKNKENIYSGEIEVSLGNDIKMQFIRIPAGEFLMGSDTKVDPLATIDETPQHEVYLDEYWIGKYPVTNIQFQQFLIYGNIDTGLYNRMNGLTIRPANHPVVDLCWNDAHLFCDWLSNLWNIILHLPTEAQWEKASRGIDGSIYPWPDGEAKAEFANYNQNFKNTTQVGNYLKGKSPFGIYDMAGNVWEWVYDFKGSYRADSVKNPFGPPTGKFRILKGGSWYSGPDLIRCAYRYWSFPTSSSFDFGFRCALRIK